MKNRERKFFGAFDVVVILIAVAASVLAFFSQFNNGSDNLTCVVRVKGEVVNTIVLSEVSAEYSLAVDGELPVVVRVSDTKVSVASSACPDKLCEHSGEISRSGQSIVCLPAKVSVTLESDSSDFDIVVG